MIITAIKSSCFQYLTVKCVTLRVSKVLGLNIDPKSDLTESFLTFPACKCCYRTLRSDTIVSLFFPVYLQSPCCRSVPSYSHPFLFSNHQPQNVLSSSSSGATAQRLTHEVSRSHTMTQSVGLHWTRDRSLGRDLYLTTHNTHNRKTFMPSTRLEPAIPASDRPQTLALNRLLPGMGQKMSYHYR